MLLSKCLVSIKIYIDIIRRILDFMHRDWRVSFLVIPREFNVVADRLAKLCVGGSSL